MEKSGKPLRLVNSDTPQLVLAAIIGTAYRGEIACKLYGCYQLSKDWDPKGSNNTHQEGKTSIIDYFLAVYTFYADYS